MFKRLLLSAYGVHRQLFRQQFLRMRRYMTLVTSHKVLIIAGSGLVACRCSAHFIALAKEQVFEKQLIEEADRIYNSGNHKELYDYLRKHSSSEDCDVLWRLARAARDLALKWSGVSPDEKKRLIYEAFDSAKRAVDADEFNFAAHKWFAITIGDVGDYEGVKAKISNAYVIRDHLERAAELNPKDATTLHCLGMWCYVFADMPRWQHVIAGIIFGTPPTSNFKEAAEYFLQAEKVDPNFYSVNLLMLGKSYMKIGDMKRAMLYLDYASNYPATNAEDREAKMEADQLLKVILEKK